MNTSVTEDSAVAGHRGKTLESNPDSQISSNHHSMAFAILVLVGFQLLGETLRSVLNLPLPGAVIGMFTLMAVLVFRRGSATVEDGAAAPSALTVTANALIANMGLLFVPAGVGILAEIDLLRANWLPIVAGVVGSTLLSLIVTGLIMQHIASATTDRSGVK